MPWTYEIEQTVKVQPTKISYFVRVSDGLERRLVEIRINDADDIDQFISALNSEEKQAIWSTGKIISDVDYEQVTNVDWIKQFSKLRRQSILDGTELSVLYTNAKNWADQTLTGNYRQGFINLLNQYNIGIPPLSPNDNYRGRFIQALDTYLLLIQAFG